MSTTGNRTPIAEKGAVIPLCRSFYLRALALAAAVMLFGIGMFFLPMEGASFRNTRWLLRIGPIAMGAGGVLFCAWTLVQGHRFVIDERGLRLRTRGGSTIGNVPYEAILVLEYRKKKRQIGIELVPERRSETNWPGGESQYAATRNAHNCDIVVGNDLEMSPKRIYETILAASSGYRIETRIA